MSSRNDRTYGKALDLWQAPPNAGEPLICIATSYTFDATFFETECVGRFLQMEAHPSESASVAYLIEREEKLAGARVHALVDRRHARDKESLRWDIIGILVPRAVQHAKLAVLAWKNHVRIIIGSGNLTEPGYRKNVEVFGTLELSREHGGAKDGFAAVLEFLGQVAQFAVGSKDEATPKARLSESLRQLRQHVRGWKTSESRPAAVPVFNTPARTALGQVEQLWPGSSPAREAYIVSPFFDHPPNDGRAAARLKSLLAKRGETYTGFYVKTEPLLDGRTRVYAPRPIAESLRSGDKVEVKALLPEQQDEIREVHSKLFSLGNDQWRLLMIGSSNFTSAGLGLVKGAGNLEANLLYRLKTTDPDFKHLDRIWPDHREDALDSSSSALIWEPCFEEDEGDGAGACPLPASFEEALFTAGDKPCLELTLAAPLPQKWVVRLPAGRVVLSSEDAAARVHNVSWSAEPPPFVLEVSWQQAGGDTQVASWPVNVSNPAALPPPAELRDLTLEELLEILASTRPLPAAIEFAIQRRKRGVRPDSDLNPLVRHDSQAFLLRRTKRVARALDRLRERLERPALTKDALEWRLRGTVGPLRLADAFVNEAKLPGEARFCLAELALTLRRVNPKATAAGGLSVDLVRTALRDVISDVEARAGGLEVTPDMSHLDAYVTEAFREATAP